MAHGVEIILFDVGGVLVDVTGIDRLRMWTDPALSDEQVWTLWLQSDTARAFERGQIEAGQFASQLIAELHLPVQPETFLEDFPAWIAGEMPQAREMLGELAPGVRRGTLSNSNPIHWPRIMHEFGFAPFFDVHFVSHLTGRIKPDSDTFDYAVTQLECRPESIVFVDDNQVNVDAALRVGIRAHLARGPRQAREILDAYGLVEPQIRERSDDV